MNDDSILRKRRGLFIGLIVVSLVLVVGLFIFQAIQRGGKTGLVIKKMPGDSTIYINNKKFSGSTAYLNDGSYTIRAEREGFEPYSRVVKIDTKTNSAPKAFFVLTPQNDEALEWAKKNNTAYLKLEKEAGEYYEKQDAKTLEKYPIIKDLPYRSSLYSIEYYQKGDDFRVQIKSPDALGRQVAIERLKTLGYEPTDYIVEFLGLDNPFTTTNEATQ